jgi:hypothetical protein
MRKRIQIFLIFSVLALTTGLPKATAKQSGDAAAPVEQGKFTLHKFEQPIGEETYEIRRDGFWR